MSQAQQFKAPVVHTNDYTLWSVSQASDLTVTIQVKKANSQNQLIKFVCSSKKYYSQIRSEFPRWKGLEGKPVKIITNNSTGKWSAQNYFCDIKEIK